VSAQLRAFAHSYANSVTPAVAASDAELREQELGQEAPSNASQTNGTSPATPAKRKAPAAPANSTVPAAPAKTTLPPANSSNTSKSSPPANNKVIPAAQPAVVVAQEEKREKTDAEKKAESKYAIMHKLWQAASAKAKVSRAEADKALAELNKHKPK